MFLTSCGHAFHSKIRYQVEEGIIFTSAQKNIDNNVGFVFIWGGIIVNSIGSDGASGYLELAQTPLDKYERIINPDVSWGSFAVMVPNGYDSWELAPGRMISVAWILTRGINASRPSSGQIAPYTYPVLEAMEIRRWGIFKGAGHHPSLNLEKELP